jgi:hypothetical protein
MKIIDCTPKWSEIVLIYITALKEQVSPKGVEAAEKEIIRMAALADERNELARQLKLRH